MGKLAQAVTIALGAVAVALAPTAQAQPSNVSVSLQADDQVAEFVAAVQSVVNQYPTAPFTITSGYGLESGTYVGAKPGLMVVNKVYSTDPAYLSQSFAYDVANNFHSPGCSPQTYLGIHEAAHQIDYTHGMRARAVALAWARTTSAVDSDLSGYSFDGNGYFAPAEALAEAFAAVKCDPAGSTQAEYDLYSILVSTA